MPVAQLDIDSILYDLDKIRSSGLLLKEPKEISRLERRIDAIKAEKNSQPASMESVAKYYITLAALRCLTGDFEQIVSLGDQAVRLTTEPQSIMNQVATLTVAGYFSKARMLLDRLSEWDLLSVSPEQNVAALIADCQLYGIEDSVMNSLAERFPENAKQLIEAKQILDSKNVTEKQLLKMLDLAGEKIRSKSVFFPSHAQLYTYPNDEFMTISLPVNLSPREVAELEWEYTGEVIAMFPEHPYSSISIGFCCNHYA